MPFRGHARSSDFGKRQGLGGDQGPVRGYSAPCSIQRFKTSISAGVSRLPAFSGGHAQRLIFLGDPDDQRAGFGIARDDRLLAALERLDGRFAMVEPQTLGPFRLVLTVASETVLGEDRPDFAVEVDLPRFGRAPLRRHRSRARKVSNSPTRDKQAGPTRAANRSRHRFRDEYLTHESAPSASAGVGSVRWTIR